jgi:hypothetical protein
LVVKCGLYEVAPHDKARIEALLDLARTIGQTQVATDFFREDDVLDWTRNMPSKKGLDLIDSLPCLMKNVIGWYEMISDPARGASKNFRFDYPSSWVNGRHRTMAGTLRSKCTNWTISTTMRLVSAECRWKGRPVAPAVSVSHQCRAQEIDNHLPERDRLCRRRVFTRSMPVTKMYSDCDRLRRSFDAAAVTAGACIAASNRSIESKNRDKKMNVDPE